MNAAFICTRRRVARPTCFYCGADSKYLCDAQRYEDGTCDRQLCDNCTVTRKTGPVRDDYCREHRVAAGLSPYVTALPLSRGFWVEASKYPNNCAVCAKPVEMGARIFYVPVLYRTRAGESTAFCEPCGQQQLQLQKVSQS